MEEKVFAVKFECANCGAKWEEQFCRGDRVDKKSSGVWVEDHRCTGGPSCPYCRYIECPVCGRGDDVLIRERYPIEEEYQGGQKSKVHEMEFVDGTTYSRYTDGVKVEWKTSGLVPAK
ncbi:MAG: hypothetical protein ACTSSA_14715 [Candidatus Freyarchaeota archaeon]